MTPPTPDTESPDTAAAPTVDDVRRIARSNDPVIRNLQITQTYHDLSGAIARLTRGHANWCAFATWASRQAGQTIRQEDLRRSLERLVHRSVETEASAAEVASTAAAIRGGDGRRLS